MTPPDEVLRKMAEAVREPGIDPAKVAHQMRLALTAAAECGWVLVPKVATEEMLDAINANIANSLSERGDGVMPEEVYAAMLAAAPKVTP